MTTTVFILVTTLTNEHRLVGNKGGISHCWGLLGTHPLLGVLVETEHGVLLFKENEYVEVVDE